MIIYTFGSATSRSDCCVQYNLPRWLPNMAEWYIFLFIYRIIHWLWLVHVIHSPRSYPQVKASNITGSYHFRSWGGINICTPWYQTFQHLVLPKQFLLHRWHSPNKMKLMLRLMHFNDSLVEFTPAHWKTLPFNFSCLSQNIFCFLPQTGHAHSQYLACIPYNREKYHSSYLKGMEALRGEI